MEVLKIWFDKENIFLKTKAGIEKSMPLKWFPKLQNATLKQRENFKLSPYGIHWEEIDEDLSFEGFFKFQKEEIEM
ncbi:MAG: DUF2442 domain-containing protein [Chitinophagales bacterium]|nr:DUF2442 domain-containing protein [Bacteroidota bacterium]MCB9042887.1 DUF2442 domain-containing protein [Chitinophagales bacterium]